MRRREFVSLVCGVAFARPIAARAQKLAKIHRIAIVHPTMPVRILSDLGVNPNLAAFIAELARLGNVEGANLTIDRFSGEGIPPERLSELAHDVVRQAPDLIFAMSATAAKPIKEATRNVPM
jgi:putative ABC transport system substrate-binding protein